MKEDILVNYSGKCSKHLWVTVRNNSKWMSFHSSFSSKKKTVFRVIIDTDSFPFVSQFYVMEEDLRIV